VEIGPDVWLRTDLGPVILACFAGARMVLGREAILSNAHLSAKRELVLGRRAWVGPGTRVFDSDQHDFDADRPEAAAPVRIGDYAWVAADCTVLKGVTIGEHAVVGTRSLVTGDVPAHALVYGAPATPRGTVGDRSRVR
jgi:acetyltransferase-like isoleucine patch superfamily enzyme